MIWNILIPSLQSRSTLMYDLCQKVQKQIKDINCVDNIIIEVLLDDGEMTIGEKRNTLLQYSTSDYICFIDDDDDVSDDYISSIWKALQKSPDCVNLIGLRTDNGTNPQRFYHSIDYDHYFDYNGSFFRPPNHLNIIKTSIAKQFKFLETNWGEDTDWAMQICESKLLKNEASEIRDVIYYYRYNSSKSKGE